MMLRPMQRTVDVPPPRPSPVRPYPPSFASQLLHADRLDRRVGWLLYGAVAFGALALELTVAWAEGTLPARAGVIHVGLPVLAFAALPVLAFFNRIARRAMATARPVLVDDEVGYKTQYYRLTTLPAGPTLLAAVGGLLLFVGLTVVQPADTYETLQIFVTPLATVVEGVLQFLTWSGIGVVIFDIARKLWIIDDIYRHHLRINVLSPGPVYAFARLAGAMVVLTMVFGALGMFALSDLATTVQGLVLASVPAALAAIAFVAPLWGAHRLMAEAKSRNVDELGERIETTIQALRERVDQNDLDRVGPLKDALDGLITARNEFLAVSTWPWQRSTLGGVVTALGAPLALWLLTRLIESSSIV
jgi:hypothetical protein